MTHQPDPDRLIDLMRSSSLEDPPPHVLNRAVRLFRQQLLAQQQAPQKPNVLQVIAGLLFDSQRSTTAPAFGVRGAASTGERQLVFAADMRDLELRISPSGDSYQLVGQLLGDCASGGMVELSGPAAQTAELSEDCAFSISGLPAGTYSLHLRLVAEAVDIAVMDLPIGV